ncbi:MAG: hypothetical protein US51_C0028G0002 [Microgenomates group bacterium GW2011_GWA2_37_6]|nr:MAG: hypothetical protein US51_C0028G0002 [Microgenomates group bacterium GW2011_GWA2_37_6]
MPDAQSIAEMRPGNVDPRPPQAQSTSSSNAEARPVGATSVPPAEQPKLTQADLIEGGTSKVEVKINPKTMAELLDRMKIKAKHAKSIQDRQGKLSPTDTYLLDAGVIQRLESGQLTREDYIIALLDINDELSQKAFASGRLVREGKGRLSRRPPTVFDTYIGAPIRDSSYIQEARYTPSEAELRSLNQLRIQLNESLFGKGFKDPLFDEINTSIYPARLLSESRHDVYSEIGRQVENIIAERVKAGTLPLGETPQNLWLTNRREMALVVREANHRALEQMTLDRATAILKSPPEISREAITDRVNALRQPPTREELTALEEAKTQVDTRATEAQEEFTSLNNELTQLKRLEEAYTDADAKAKEGQRINGTLDAAANTTTGGFLQLQQTMDALRQSIRGQAQGTKEIAIKISAAHERYDNLRRELSDLLSAKATAEQRYNQSVKDRIKALEGTPAVPATATTPAILAVTGLVEQAKTTLNTAKTAAKTAGETHAIKVKELDAGPSAESKQRADDLEEWGTAFDKYGSIMDTQRKQKAGDPYTLDRLSDSTLRADGQIEGAERIRESIFLVADPSKYSPEQARRLISNDAIAKGVIHIYEIPINVTMGTSGRTIRQIGSDIEAQQQRLNALLALAPAARTPNYDTLVAIARTNVNNNQLELIQTTISSISSTDRIKALRLLDFLAKEGAKSAQKGNPDLEIDRHYFNT